MTDRPFRIFVVDDDALLRMVTVDQLQGHGWDIHEYDSGGQCLEALDLEPNLILLDIEMPEQNGLDVCRCLRADGHDEVQVMFVSAHDDLDTLLAAFAAGGNDFITKSAATDVLLRKVELAIETEVHKRQLQAQLSYAQQAAFTAMSSLGETGIVLQFLRASFGCLSIDDLGVLLVDAMSQFGVHGMAKLNDGKQDFFFCSESNCSPIERSILSYVGKMGRISQKDDRLVFNYPHTTLLIMGLDLADSDGIGRLRDHLAIVAEAAGVRIDTMSIEQQRLQEAQSRIENVKELAALLGEVETFQNINRSRLEKAVEQHRIDMEHAFINLGLTDSQEHQLCQIVDALLGQLDDIFDNDNKLALRLSAILDKQRKLLEGQ